jgi:hypothetical protein
MSEMEDDVEVVMTMAIGSLSFLDISILVTE